MLFSRCLLLGTLAIFTLLPHSRFAAAADQTVTFVFQPVLSGQQIKQQVSIRTNTTTTYEQSQQIISSSDNNDLNEQIRQITVLESDPKSTRIEVTYSRAILKAGKSILAKSRPQSVDKQSYIVTRIDGELMVTDKHGNTPPEQELDIVRSNMQWVGQPNPLAQFLNGRTITLGESLQLPKHLATDLIGGANGLGAVDRVTLKLKQIRKLRGRRCGVFDAVLVADSVARDKPKVRIVGDIAIEIATCRSMDIKMDTNLDLREQRGPVGATFTVSNRGQVRIAIKATYGNRLF